MRIYTRKKNRCTGKTTDLINIAEIFINYGRKVLIISMNRPMQLFIKNQLENKLPGSKLVNCFYGIPSNLDFAFRGHRFQVILVDDWDLLTPSMQETINIHASIASSALLCTSER